MHEGEAGRYPGYDVLAKRNSPSWNEKTRRVIDARLSLPDEPRFFTAEEWTTLRAVCARIVPQPAHRAVVPVAALVDNKLHTNSGDGFRNARLPRMQEAWQRGLRAFDEEARQAYGRAFHRLQAEEQDALLKGAESGALRHPAWGGMPSRLFFNDRLLRDVVHAYYSYPTAWNEIGFGGPASPRGYVRMGFDRRDPWEAAEAKGGDEEHVRRISTSVLDEPLTTPRAKNGRAPDVFREGGWVPMREYREDDEVDFAIVGTGAGGGTLSCKLAEAGFSVVCFDAGPYWRPLEDFASDEMEQNKLYWTDERICDGENPLQLGSNNSGKSVGGSTVHFAMVSLRFRPEWFKSRSLLGYGADWPLDWREMWRSYHEVEQALKIAGPVTYPWGPKRPRYPFARMR